MSLIFCVGLACAAVDTATFYSAQPAHVTTYVAGVPAVYPYVRSYYETNPMRLHADGDAIFRAPD
jgi:hypothetical protein